MLGLDGFHEGPDNGVELCRELCQLNAGLHHGGQGAAVHHLVLLLDLPNRGQQARLLRVAHCGVWVRVRCGQCVSSPF